MSDKQYFNLGLFGEKDEPDVISAWNIYEKGLKFNTQININDTVKANENFYIGKQWEGVQSNGLPTPTFNILKRVVGFIVATITTDNIKVNASRLSNQPEPKGVIADPIEVVNNEFEALTELNDVPGMLRKFSRNAAVDGDGCMYTYWDADVDCGNGIRGAIKTEILDNIDVLFGNPNDRDVQSQPYITIVSREICRSVMKRAIDNESKDWKLITPDTEGDQDIDAAKYTDDRTTVLLTLWRDEESGEIWGYESTKTATVKKPWSLGIRLYPICWLPWDYIKDCYHGQAMITGLIPNQIFINKAWAMTMLSIMRSAFPKTVYDKTRVKSWDNRVGGAIGIAGGDVNTVAKILDPAQVSPQISQYIQLAVEQTEQSLGATSVALGDTRPDNTSAIIALQRAAATPSEMTKQNLYKAIEELFRIYLEFMAEYYGKRPVNIATPDVMREVFDFMQQQTPEQISPKFDFSELKKLPMMLKLDVGASSYYSEIAAMQTLDNLLMNGHITAVQYLERVPDGYVPKRRALISELKEKEEMAMAQMQQPEIPPTGGGGGPVTPPQRIEIPGGRGNGALQRAINAGKDV